MQLRVPSQSAPVGRSPVASVGLRLGAQPDPESLSERTLRNALAGVTLDEFGDESIPGIDPAAPYAARRRVRQESAP